MAARLNNKLNFNRIHFIAGIFLILFFFLFFTSAAGAEIGFISLHGDIDPGQASFLSRALSEAEDRGVDAVIIEIETYGGLVDSAINMRDQIIDYPLPIITFVNQRAWSAGALLAIAGEELYMVSGSSIGAAETRPQEEKFIAALSREFAATAERQGRDADIAAAMVDIDREIENVIERGKLLSLTAGEAANLGFIDGRVENLDEFLAKKGWTEADLFTIEKTSIEVLAGMITHPVITVILLTLGITALAGEALVPGFGFSGTVGVLSLAVFFSAYLYQGYAGLGLLALFLAGLILILIEIFLIPGFGVTGAGGLLAIFVSLFLFIPDQTTALRIIVAVIILSAVSIAILLKIFGGSNLWKRISLDKSETVEEGYVSRAEEEDLSGKEGRAITPLRPSGVAEIEGRRVDVVSQGDFIDKGKKIKVLSSKGSRIVVAKINKEE